MVNAETLFVQAFNSFYDDVDAFMDVPEKRPARFVTVERTGGGVETFRDLPTLAVQAWAGSRYLASEFAQQVRDEFILGHLKFHPNVARVTVGSIYNFPDPDSGHPRYQITLSMVTK